MRPHPPYEDTMRTSRLASGLVLATLTLGSVAFAQETRFPDLEGHWTVQGRLADGRSLEGTMTFNLVREPWGPRNASRWRFTYEANIAGNTTQAPGVVDHPCVPPYPGWRN